MGVVDQALADRIGDGGIPDALVPVAHWELPRQQGGAAPTPIIHHLEGVPPLRGEVGGLPQRGR
jgi:hypothetical protein